MTDHNTDTHTTNGCTIYQWVYVLAMIILIFTGAFHGPEVLFQIGMGLFLLPFAVGILASAFVLIIIAICHPVKGVIIAFVGVNITMIAMHDCGFEIFFNLAFSCFWAAEIPILLFSIGYLCRTSYYQRNAVVREAVVVHRFTEENNNNNNNNNSASSLDYYWVGEYEAPSSLQYVTPNNGDEKRTTSIQLCHSNGNQQQGAVEKNGLEECSCTEEEEEEEVCYKIQQQRFHKKFLVTVDLYQAASLEVLVLPGRPNSAMLTKPLEENRRISKFVSIFLTIHAGGFSFPGVVIPLKIFFGDSKNTWCGQDDDYTCSEWQTYVPYITLVVMVMFAVSSFFWNGYQKGEFAAVTVHNPAGGEQELVTVVGPQNKKEEDEYHHHINDDDDDKTETETETACTSRELDNDDETACTRELDNVDDTTYIREPIDTGRNGAFLV